MKLFKNVDICDLESILDKGILSLDESGNDNWDSDKRANNSTSVVYLFQPIGELNSFVDYGCALVECEVNAAENEFEENDTHKNDYREFIVERVASEAITAIYVPEMFKDRVDLPSRIMNRITWCGMTAEHYDGEAVSDEEMNQFAATAQFERSSGFNFFRGITAKNTMIDLYNVKYVF